MDAGVRHQNFLGENPETRLAVLTDTPYPRFLATMGGSDEFREPIEVDAESFIGVKSFKARGKRVTTLNVAKVEELEPLRMPEPAVEAPVEETAEKVVENTVEEEVVDDSMPIEVMAEEAEEAPQESSEDVADEVQDKSEKSKQDLADEMNGQLHLFD